MSTKQLSAAPYLLGYLALVGLAVISVIIAKATHWPYWSLTLNLAIAVIQAVVALWCFMHFGEVSFQTRLAVGVGLSMLLTLLLLTTADVATRRVQPRGPAPGPNYGFYKR